MVSEPLSDAEKTQRAFARMRLFTVLITLALIAFTLWISEGVTLGRVIAAGVLGLGFLQWVVLGRVAHQIAASRANPVETDQPTR